LEATHTNLSAVFGLYEDSDKKIAPLIESLMGGKPDYDGRDKENVRHEAWVVRDENIHSRLQEFFSKKKIYIADGHHRYQTALDHALRMRAKEHVGSGDELSSDFALAALVEMSDPGLILMATHRMILPFAGFQPEKAVQALGSFFEVESMPVGQILNTFKTEGPAPVQMGLLTGGKSFLLTLKDIHQAMETMAISKPEAWCRLDVTLLSHLILARLWHVDESQWVGLIRYTHAASEAVQKANSGQFAAVFLLKDPPVKILYDMGEIGELLPQKTTYFYPKLASGIVFYHHQS